jgi:hypothetical protein
LKAPALLRAGLHGKLWRHRDGAMVYYEAKPYAFGEGLERVVAKICSAYPKAKIFAASNLAKGWAKTGLFQVMFLPFGDNKCTTAVKRVSGGGQ